MTASTWVVLGLAWLVVLGLVELHLILLVLARIARALERAGDPQPPTGR